LINASHRYQSAIEADALGIKAENVTIDFEKVQEWKSGVVSQLTGGVQGLLKANKVEIVRGEAYFSGENTLRVINDDSAQTYSFKNAIIATGSRPIEIPAFPYSDRVLNSTGALALKEIPKKLV